MRKYMLALGLFLVVFGVGGCFGKGRIMPRAGTVVPDTPYADYLQNPSINHEKFYYEVDAKYHPPQGAAGLNLTNCPRARLDLEDDNQAALLLAELRMGGLSTAASEPRVPVFSYSVTQGDCRVCRSDATQKRITNKQLFSENTSARIVWAFKYIKDYQLNGDLLAGLVSDAQSLLDGGAGRFVHPDLSSLVTRIDRFAARKLSVDNRAILDFPVYDRGTHKMNTRFEIPLAYDDGEGRLVDAGRVVFTVSANPTRFSVGKKDGVPQFSGRTINTLPNLYYEESGATQSLRALVKDYGHDMELAGEETEELDHLLAELNVRLSRYELTEWDRLFCLYLAAKANPRFGRSREATNLSILLKKNDELTEMGIPLPSLPLPELCAPVTEWEMRPVFDALFTILSTPVPERGTALVNDVFVQGEVEVRDSTGILEVDGNVAGDVLAGKFDRLYSGIPNNSGCYYPASHEMSGGQSVRQVLNCGAGYNAVAVYRDGRTEIGPLLFIVCIKTDEEYGNRIKRLLVRRFSISEEMGEALVRWREAGNETCQGSTGRCVCLIEAILAEQAHAEPDPAEEAVSPDGGTPPADGPEEPGNGAPFSI